MDHSAPIELLDPYVPGLIKQRLALDPTPIAEPVIEKTQAAALMADVLGREGQAGQGIALLDEALAAGGGATAVGRGVRVV